MKNRQREKAALSRLPSSDALVLRFNSIDHPFGSLNHLKVNEKSSFLAVELYDPDTRKQFFEKFSIVKKMNIESWK